MKSHIGHTGNTRGKAPWLPRVSRFHAHAYRMPKMI